MKVNPYLRNNRQMVMAKTGGSVKDELRLPGSQERAIGGNDELNAGSKKELMQRISGLVDSYQRGEIVSASNHEDIQVAQARRELVEAAIADKNGPAWQVLGENFAPCELKLAA